MRVTYVGPHDAVEVPSLGVACARGESLDVPNDIGHELIKQDSWETAKIFDSAPMPATDEDEG